MNGNPGAHPPNPMKRPKKRIITPARREQNKIAQRAYRQRQKEVKETSQRGDVGRKRRRLEPRCNLESSLSSSAACSLSISNGSPASVAFETDVEARTVQADTLPLHNTEPPYTGDDIDLVTPDLDASQFSDSDITSFPDYNAALDVLQCSVDLHANTLEDAFTTIYTACLRNATCLGLNICDLVVCNSTYMSPFFRPTTARDDPKALVASSARSSLPAHLQPTLAQILIPHHVSIDLIPLPLFRERAIMMSAALPRVFDLWDMKLDIYVRNALTCWRHRRGATCQPWDMRSWEAAPWFLRKWAMVTGGAGGFEMMLGTE